MKASLPMQLQVIQQYCKQLRVPTMGAQFRSLAEAAIHQQQSHLDFLEALLAAEIEEREHNLVQRRLKDARLPKSKTRCQVEREGHGRELSLMVDREGLDLRGEVGKRAQRYLRTTRPDYENLGQCRWIVLELWLDLENELVLTGRGVEVRDLTLTERVIERLVDQ